MENHSFDASDPGGAIGTPGYIVGNPDAPYINGTLIPQGTLFSNYYSTTHPSLPAYLDMTAGQHGSCTDDVTCPRDSLTFDNIFQLLGKTGISFASYVQSMPTNCALTSTDVYSVDHNPEAYLADVDAASGLPYDCPRTDVPFPTDWATLPAFSLVVPDRCHDMEGSASNGPCPKKTDAIITAGDTWLSQTVPTLVSTGADVIVVFDEATGGDKRNGGGHVLSVEVGPGVVAGSTDGTFYNHFSLLSGLEGRLGLSPLVGGAASANPPLPIPGAAPATPPTITDVQPNMGAPGDLVTISGTGFSNTYAVRFNGLDAAFDVGNDSSITATVPISASSGPISVAVPGATVSSPSTFTVTTSQPGVAITSFSPTSGAPGTQVTIDGSGFGSTTDVSFGATSASFTVISDSQLAATVPPSASSGPITVMTTDGSATSSASFTVGTPIKTVNVTVGDDFYRPKAATTVPGGDVVWTFTGSHPHAVRDAALLGAGSTPLFDSGSRTSGTFSWTFRAAGTYAYVSAQGEATVMKGTVAVPVTVSPSAGTSSTTFTVTVTSTPVAGFASVVQSRFQPPGGKWGAWKTIATTTATGLDFTPASGAGGYQFRSRLRNVDTGRMSGQSPVRQITVS